MIFNRRAALWYKYKKPGCLSFNEWRHLMETPCFLSHAHSVFSTSASHSFIFLKAVLYERAGKRRRTLSLALLSLLLQRAVIQPATIPPCAHTSHTLTTISSPDTQAGGFVHLRLPGVLASPVLSFQPPLRPTGKTNRTWDLFNISIVSPRWQWD